jgi:Domain of unknown function (DUF3471)
LRFVSIRRKAPETLDAIRLQDEARRREILNKPGSSPCDRPAADPTYFQTYERFEALKRAIALATGELQKFVGQYPLNPQVVLTVRQEGDQLSFQATGKGPLPIYPESANEFFARRAHMQISFVQGADGKVTGLVLHETGHDVPTSRISDTTTTPPK